MSKASRERERVRAEKFGRRNENVVMDCGCFIVPIWEISFFNGLMKMNSDGELQQRLGNCPPDVDLFGPYLEEFLFTPRNESTEELIRQEVNAHQNDIMDLEQILFSVHMLYEWSGKKAKDGNNYYAGWVKTFEKLIHFIWNLVRTKPFASQFYEEMN